MTQLAELEVLSEEQQVAAYQKAERELAERAAAWKMEQEKFFNENPEYRDDPDLNLSFVSEVNRLLSSDKSKTMTDRQVLESAFVRVFLKGGVA